MVLTGANRSTRKITCPSATLSITNPTYTDPVTNPGLHGESPETNHLSYTMASMYTLQQYAKFSSNNISSFGEETMFAFCANEA
jgi:hypothetical protein